MRKRTQHGAKYLSHGLVLLMLISLAGPMSDGATVAEKPGTGRLLPFDGVPEDSLSLPAFPGAEGFGATTPGGRGGEVLIVDKLADDGSAGTLRWAVNQQKPRTIVFRVSGIIELTEPLAIGGDRNARFAGDNPYSYVTIAGQTAPGGGIVLTHFPITMRNNVHDIIIRHLRIRNTRVDKRLGSIGDGVEFAGTYNVVLDHVSVSWIADEGISLESEGNRSNHDVTIQNCLVAEGLFNGGHPSGGPHSRAMVASDGSFNVSMHHNLMISCNKRNPSLAGNSELGFAEFPVTDVRYNLVYNFGEKAIQFGRGALTNIVGNIIRFGPDTTAEKAMENLEFEDNGTKVYLRDNCTIKRMGTVDILDCPGDQVDLVFSKRGLFAQFVDSPFLAPPVTPTEDLQTFLLDQAGALPHDPADEDFINDYLTYTGSLGADNRSQDEITVLPPAAGLPPVDSDLDGMPDDWEIENGLDPRDPSDASGDVDGDGYTNLEEYLNERAEELGSGQPASRSSRDLELGIAFPPAGDSQQREFAAGHLENLAVTLVRLSASWKRAEPTQDTFDWSLIDGHIQWAHDNNISLLLTIPSNAPDWACKEPGIRGGCVPTNMNDFEDFVQALVHRLKEFDEELPNGLPVSKIQFGNEWDDPDVGFYPGTAEEFTTQLNIVYDTVKGAFPDMPVLPGGLLNDSMKSIAICAGSDHFGVISDAEREAFCSRTKQLAKVARLNDVFTNGRYDMVDQHLYFDPENWKVYIDTLRNLVLPPSKREIPIIASEFGGPNAKTESRDDEFHAARVKDYIEALLETDVSEAYYFKLVEPPEKNIFGQQSAFAESGLISKETALPKPGYYVFQGFAKELNLGGAATKSW